jgi:hypothetical protein
MWLREIVTKALINPIIRTRTRHFRRAYHPTRDSIINVRKRIVSLLSVTSQAPAQRWMPKLIYWGCDNVLPGQRYHTSQGATTDDYGTMVEWCLVGEIEENRRNASSKAISSSINITWSPGIEPWSSGEKPVSDHLIYSYVKGYSHIAVKYSGYKQELSNLFIFCGLFYEAVNI